MKFSLLLLSTLLLVDTTTTCLQAAASNVEKQTPKIAPQCTSRDPDGTCVAEEAIDEEDDDNDDDDAFDNEDSEEDEEEEDEYNNFQESEEADTKIPSEPYQYPEKCGLYMAESSIPNAGWGMFANQDIEQGNPIHPLDVVIQAYDTPMWVREDPLGGRSWLLSEYVWNPQMTKSQFSAEIVNSIIPGFGMLANSHPGLVNAANEGSQDMRPWTDRSNPVTGSFTEYNDLTFVASDDIAKGQEIFVEYGDHWFEHRTGFGKIPLSTDFMAADHLLGEFANRRDQGKWDKVLGEELWDVGMDILKDYEHYERILNALPPTGATANEWLNLYPTQTSAKATVPNLIRSEEWLEENGMCLDNIEIKDAGDKGKGAFATRFLAKGSLVAPAPVVHLSKEHLKLKWEESFDHKDEDNKRTLWEGYQLLLNYCYGNPMTSLLFFPYSVAVNVINHGKEPNVAIRWSNNNKSEMMDWSTKKVLKQNRKAGLMMEIYALRDIQPGEEVLLDYGEDWQHSWDVHDATYIHPVHLDDFKVAWDYDNGEELYVSGDPKHPPSYVETRCWIDYDAEDQDEEGFYAYQEIGSADLDDTLPCTLIGKEELDGMTFYKVTFYDSEIEKDVKVKGVTWNMITYVDKAYTGNQHLRQSFRHYIELPDEMIPPSWRDLGLDIEDNSECGMYMAESAIPHSGLGMYTARAVRKDERIFYGDVVVQVEDIFDNNRLREWHFGNWNYTQTEWLLEHYFWTAESSLSQYDAGFIESMVPGFGMLANSHTGLHNAAMRIPIQTTDLHRVLDPGTGAASTYHDVYYVAEKDMEAGEEIFVEYGDNYFMQRDDLQFVPLSVDFKYADGLLQRLLTLAGGDDFESEMAADLFDIALGMYQNSNTRPGNAFPRSLEDAKIAIKKGSAEVNVPEKVRSNDWLKQNGVCIDNIVPAKSRIVQAGQGAFATRKIKKGDIVTPVPVVQVKRDDLDIYDADRYDQPSEIWYEGKQIILNYCYGHPESSLLLFPYAPSVNYVNHHITKFNVELQWSTLPNHKTEFLNMRPRDINNLDRVGLIMDMVATRDIEVGEEIYLNYGNIWQEKWDKHVAEWKPDPEMEGYIPAWKLNHQVEWLRTQDELEEDSYPPNVFTACWIPPALHDARAVKRAKDRKPFPWIYEENMFNDATNIDECEVIKRETSVDPNELNDTRDSFRPPHVTYTVLVSREENPQLGPLIMSGVPRSAILFLDAMYTNDQYVRGSFRQEIGLPDAMVPELWRDLRQKQE